jgi:hypothetical protein
VKAFDETISKGFYKLISDLEYELINLFGSWDGLENALDAMRNKFFPCGFHATVEG